MDIDDVAVKIARDNVALNNLSDVIEVQAGDIVEELKQKHRILSWPILLPKW